MTGKFELLWSPWQWFFWLWEATSYLFLLTPVSSVEIEKYEMKAVVAYLACCCSVSAGENGATWILQCCCCCWSLWSCCQDWESPLLCWIPAAALRLQCREWNFALSASSRDTAPLERSSCTTATSVPLLPSGPVGNTVNHGFIVQWVTYFHHFGKSAHETAVFISPYFLVLYFLDCIISSTLRYLFLQTNEHNSRYAPLIYT